MGDGGMGGWGGGSSLFVLLSFCALLHWPLRSTCFPDQVSHCSFFLLRSDKNSSRRRTPEELNKEPRRASFARWMEELDDWVQATDDAVERPTCSNQRSPMSDYHFETDYPEWREELTRGKRTTADPTEDMEVSISSHTMLFLFC